jgi:hypothetical protein
VGETLGVAEHERLSELSRQAREVRSHVRRMRGAATRRVDRVAARLK